MENIIWKFGLGMWTSLILLISLYLIKEIVRLIIENQINKRKSKDEIQYKYAEKLLDKKVPVYIEHYSFLKKSIGVYIYLVENYMHFKNWDDNVYENLKNNKIYNFEDKDKAYRESLGYRICENLSYYISEIEDLKVKSMNILGLNQLFIKDQLIEKSKDINNLIDEEINKLVVIREELEKNYKLSNEKFLALYEDSMSKLDIKSFVTNIEYYLEKVKSEFYKEYDVDKQKYYINN